MLVLLFSFISGFTSISAQAADSNFEVLAQAKYQAFTRDFETNPYFRTDAINRSRDGEASSFMGKVYGEKINNAVPVPTDVLKRIAEFHMPPYRVFRLALLGHENLIRKYPQRVRKPDLLSIVNFDEPIQSRRFYVFDLKNDRVLFNTFVSHGFKSDPNFDGVPEVFGNQIGSNQSSLGFFITGSRAGPSSKFKYTTGVDGVDGNLNNRARSREILFHEWKNLSIEMLGSANRFKPLYGATEGCFGLPAYESGRFYGLADRPLSDLIINTIVGQSVLFSYSSKVDLESLSLYLAGER